MTAHDPAAHRDALVRLAAGMLANPEIHEHRHPDEIAERANRVYWSIVQTVDSHNKPDPNAPVPF